MNCDYCGHVPKLGVEHPLRYHGPEGRKNSWHCESPECVKKCAECQDMIEAVAPTDKPGKMNAAPGYAELMARLKGGA